MRKRIGKLSWWLPVINAVVVGLTLWWVNDINWRAVFSDEAVIALFILAYVFIILRLPVEDSDRTTSATSAVDSDELLQTTVIGNPANPLDKPRPFLGDRYPAGARNRSHRM